MRFYQHDGNPGLQPLIATPDDLGDPEFIKEVMAADMVIGLSLHGHDSWFIWGAEIPEQLISGTLKSPPKVIYIQVDFGSNEIDKCIRAVHRIKEGVASTPHQNSDRIKARKTQRFWTGRNLAQ